MVPMAQKGRDLHQGTPDGLRGQGAFITAPIRYFLTDGDTPNQQIRLGTIYLLFSSIVFQFSKQTCRLGAPSTVKYFSC